jgi:hypothetical protein
MIWAGISSGLFASGLVDKWLKCGVLAQTCPISE